MLHACLDCGFTLLMDLEPGEHDCPNCSSDDPLDSNIIIMPANKNTTELSLGEKQRLFAKYLGQLIVWVYEQGWELTLGEGYVGDTDSKDGDWDGPHIKNSNHYRRLAQDLNLFIDGKYIADGGHMAWLAIGHKWKSYHPGLTVWGGDFSDANHVSITHNGIK